MDLQVPLRKPKRTKSAIFDPEINLVLSKRDGDVLGKGTIVKADLIQEEFNSHTAYRISGCPNFRRVRAYGLSGLSQPTVFGIKTALNRLIGHRRREDVSITWINLREEPLVYINDRPFALREVDNPTRNFSFKGTTVENIDRMETTLKSDLLAEASANCGNVLLHDEVDRDINPLWEHIDERAVETMGEVFERLNGEGYRIKYVRLPVAPESMMPAQTVDRLIQTLQASIEEDGDCEHVFNCQMGRGRSTLGMALTCLLTMWYRVISDLRGDTTDLRGSRRTDSIRAVLSKFLDDGPWRRVPPADTAHTRLHGHYALIMRLVNMLPYGQLVKDQADVAIDICSAILNLREDVATFWSISEQAHNETEREVYSNRARLYFQRYFHIILFNGYLASQMTNDGEQALATSYSQWVAERNEIANLQEALEGDPSDVLKLKLDPARLLSASDGFHHRSQVEMRQILARCGDVLSSGRILKSDYWAGMGVSSVHGVPNYRSKTDKFSGTKVIGLGQATTSGIRGVLRRIARRHGSDGGDCAVPVYWFNLREEPILYIGEDPYVLREHAHWINNVSLYQGIDPERLEDAEKRLKRDVLEEARGRHGFFMVHDETEAGGVVGHTLRLGSGGGGGGGDGGVDGSLTSDDGVVGDGAVGGHHQLLGVRTEREVFAAMERSEAGIKLTYLRVPVTSRKAPEARDYQDVFRAIAGAPPHAHLVFHTQTGGLRCTTMMVAAQLMINWRGVCALGGARMRATEFIRDTHHPSSTIPWAARQKANVSNALAKPIPGQYRVIMDLVQTLHDGQLVKAQVDEVIERFSSVLNLHKLSKWASSSTKRSSSRMSIGSSSSLRMTSVEAHKQLIYLENYFTLITLNSYLSDMASMVRRHHRSPAKHAHSFSRPPQTYVEWCASKPELGTIWAAARANPIAAVRIRRVVHESHREDEDAVLSRRDGNVLVTQTILKHDHFPGLQRKTLHPRLSGCANYRKVADLPVYGCAQPTGDGIMNALEHLQQSLASDTYDVSEHHDPDDGPSNSNVYYWTNMREEPVIYVNGRPFVVRRRDDPFSNLEITGISAERVESMEDRLKRDILQDAAMYGNRILLHDETSDGHMFTSWETISSETVLTLKEMYAHVSSQGYWNIDYARIPITDEKAPEPAAFEALTHRLERTTPSDHVIFNCQMGRGRTTTGMIIACLHHKYVTAPNIPLIISDVPSEETDTASIRYHRGEFRLILRLVRVIEDGKSIKRVCDSIIDRCSAMQNLRVAIAELKSKTDVEGQDDDALDHLTHAGLNYLSRYFFLIVFASYLRDQNGRQDARDPFDHWLEKNKDIVALLEDISFT